MKRYRILSFCLAVSAVLCLVPGCGNNDPHGSDLEATTDTAGQIWYQWSDTGLVRINFPAINNDEPTQFWTDQVRGTDILFAEGNAYIPVNTLGIIIVHNVFGAEEEVELIERFRPHLFGNRTIGNFFYHSDTFFCQLYFNTVFHSAEPPTPPIALITVDMEGENIRVVPFSFQNRHRGWELISLVPGKAWLTWSLVWKKTTAEETEFRYTLLDIETWKEKDISEDEFLSIIMPQPYYSAPAAVTELLGYIEKENIPSSVIDVKIRYAVPKQTETFRFGDTALLETEAGRLKEYMCFVYSGFSYLLHPDGIIYCYADTGEFFLLELPSLPEGFVYTSFITDGVRGIALWEEQDFINVGSSGILMFHNNAGIKKAVQ